MSTTATLPVPEGKTRWRRFTVATAIVTAVAAGLIYLTATGAIAVSLQLSGLPFKLSATNMSGTGFVQYATVEQVTNGNSGAFLPTDASQTVGGRTFDAATVTALDSASIENLHQTVCAPIPGLSFLPKNKLLVTIDAGRSAGAPALASNLVVDAPLLTASNATFTNIQIGVDKGQALGGSSDGNFAQQADRVSIDNLNQVAIGTSAGSFQLKGLSLGATFVSSCP